MKTTILTMATMLAVPLLAWPAFGQGEAPELAALVQAGELPPLEERLPIPDHVMVLDPVDEIGRYGGTLRMMHASPAMDELKVATLDPPVRWNRDFTDYIPGLFLNWSFNEDGTEVTFEMREGLKWSDGADFTSADIEFYWNDIAGDQNFGEIPRPYWGFTGQEFTAELTVNGPYSLTFSFDSPNWNFPYLLASGYWGFEQMMMPRHYLSQFHPAHNDEVENYDQLREHINWWTTPGFPTILAWSVVAYQPGVSVELTRNPYYWKTDTEGNQLPYIDRIVSTEVPDAEVQLLRVISGEVDLQARTMPSPRNIPVLIENQERGGYRWLDGWRSGAGGWPAVIVNQTFAGDETIRDLLRNTDFRRALSVAVDRELINEAVWFGLGVPQQGTISKESWHFASDTGADLYQQWSSSYAQYDPDLANSLLDGIGLTERNSEGIRLLEDGSPLRLRIDISDWGVLQVNQETAALLQENWRAVGVDLLVNQPPQAEFDELVRTGRSMLITARVGEMDLWTYPDWVFVTGATSRAFPLFSEWYRTGGASGEAPEGTGARLHDLYLDGLAVSDRGQREAIIAEAIRLHMEEGPFFIGIAGDVPMPSIASARLRNIPDYAVIVPSAVGGIGTTDPSQYYYTE